MKKKTKNNINNDRKLPSGRIPFGAIRGFGSSSSSPSFASSPSFGSFFFLPLYFSQ